MEAELFQAKDRLAKAGSTHLKMLVFSCFQRSSTCFGLVFPIVFEAQKALKKEKAETSRPL